MRHSRLKAIAIVFPLLFASVACGDDGSDEDAASRPYIDAGVEEFLDEADSPFGEEQAECMATAMVHAVGADRLAEEGVSPEEFVEADSLDDLDIELGDEADEVTEEMSDAWVGCGVDTFMVEAFAAESGGELSDGALECVVDGMDREELGAAMAEDYVHGGEEAGERLVNEVLSGVAACPDAISELMVNGIEQSSGVELADQGLECVAQHVETHPEAAGRAFSEGGTEADDFGDQLARACAEFLGG